MLTLDVALVLAVLVWLRIRRTVHARSRRDQALTVFIVLALGVVLAPTAFGQALLDLVRQVADGVTRASR
ncbi:hypothetical protein ACN20G_28365 (plasmid) [Streptomyces sp. BI20]|uniref:hypothetical protein n=1 Tax=Streptomyces sp. BI20 TaxID=3403460 RepID=UPI003C718F5F